jgi:hypothetical protein
VYCVCALTHACCGRHAAQRFKHGAGEKAKAKLKAKENSKKAKRLKARAQRRRASACVLRLGRMCARRQRLAAQPRFRFPAAPLRGAALRLAAGS